MPRHRTVVRFPQSAVLLLVSLGALAACTSHPVAWLRQPKVVPVSTAVHELEVVVPADVAMPIVLQYWERNTLVVDLQGVPSTGQVVLRPAAVGGWPVRLAFRAMPGRFEVLEVRGAARAVFPIAAGRSEAVTIDLPPAAHTAGVEKLTVSWGAADAF